MCDLSVEAGKAVNIWMAVGVPAPNSVTAFVAAAVVRDDSLRWDKQGVRGTQQRKQICQQVFFSNKLRLRYRHSAKGGTIHALQYER